MSKNGGRTSNGVANRSELVGRHLMDHPYYVAWGLAPKPLYPYRGPLITSGIGDLCDGPFRAKRGAFRVDIGNDGWNFLVGGTGGDPNVTTFDFVNGTNNSRLNSASPKEALLGDRLVGRLNDVFTRQFRVGFLVEQTPDRDNRVTLSESRDGLGLPRPEISQSFFQHMKRNVVGLAAGASQRLNHSQSAIGILAMNHDRRRALQFAPFSQEGRDRIAGAFVVGSI